MTSVLNNWASKTAASTGGGGLAPGTYDGQMGMPVKKDWEGKTFYEIPLNTESGKTNITIWDFTADEIRQAESNAGDQAKLLRKIGFAKGIYVAVGVWSQSEADAAGWNEGERSVVGSLAALDSRPCTVVVVKRKDDPSKTNVYVNEPRKGGSNGPVFDNSAPRVADEYTGNMPSLDSIPF